MCKNILQVSFYFFFTACSQTDAHFDPDTADNAKQWNHSQHETINSLGIWVHSCSMASLNSVTVADFVA